MFHHKKKARVEPTDNRQIDKFYIKNHYNIKLLQQASKKYVK